MDPFDHHHHRHHHKEEEEYPPPPPPHHVYPPNMPPPPRPHVYPPHMPPPPPQPHVYLPHHTPPPPNPLEFHHESHQHHHQPHLPHHHTHEGGSHPPHHPPNKPTFRVYSKAHEGCSLSIRDGKVILARSDPHDMHQHWIKDEKFSTRVKDEEGYPSFALVNKATGQAIKHSTGATHPVRLVHYNPDHLDESILWAEKDLGDGFKVIRMVNNIRLNLDGFHGDKNHGGVHDGTIAVLWEWKKGDNQRWRIVPY